MRALFQFQEGEEAVFFVNIGTISKQTMLRFQPETSEFVSSL